MNKDLQYIVSVAGTAMMIVTFACCAAQAYGGQIVKMLRKQEPEPKCTNCGGVGHVAAVNHLSGTLQGGRERCKVCMPDPVEVRRNLVCELA